MIKMYLLRVTTGRRGLTNMLVGPCYYHSGQTCPVEMAMNEVFDACYRVVEVRVRIQEDLRERS